MKKYYYEATAVLVEQKVSKSEAIDTFVLEISNCDSAGRDIINNCSDSENQVWIGVESINTDKQTLTIREKTNGVRNIEVPIQTILDTLYNSSEEHTNYEGREITLKPETPARFYFSDKGNVKFFKVEDKKLTQIAAQKSHTKVQHYIHDKHNAIGIFSNLCITATQYKAQDNHNPQTTEYPDNASAFKVEVL